MTVSFQYFYFSVAMAVAILILTKNIKPALIFRGQAISRVRGKPSSSDEKLHIGNLKCAKCIGELNDHLGKWFDVDIAIHRVGI